MKKRTTLFVGIILCYVFPSFGQYYPDKALSDTANYPYWQEMMQDPNANFYATVSAFNKYWENRTDHKGNGWKVFKRWEYINKDLVLPNGKLPGPDYFLKERQKYESTHNVKSASGNWTNIGPTAYPANATSQPTGLGRVNCFGFDPVSASTFYAGTPAGGIWKTTDNGASWTLLNEGMPTLGVSSILVNPNNGNEILIGTGDRDASDSYGLGVYKSTDGGATWNASNSGMGNLTVGMMIRNPADADMILAATSSGIYKSIDGGANWVLKYGSGYNFKDIKFKPGDFNIVYATKVSHFYRSENAGESWTDIYLSPYSNRIVIGVSADDPTIVYLLRTLGPFRDLLKSTDYGVTFTSQSTSPNIMDYACDGSGTGSQAFYDQCIAVDPNDANIIYAGGINVWKSTDGGVNWVISSHWVGRDYGADCDVNAPSVHADQHALQWSPLTSKLFLGNDGGVYYTDNGGTDWPQISDGLGIAQIYKLGQSVSQNNLVTTGHQDNGTHIYDGTTFTTVIGGDGMECIIDYSDANYRYGGGPQGSISRFVTSGYYHSIKNNITETGAWVTPYILHNSNANTMFAGYKNVWRTTNVKAANSSNVSWTAISTGETSNCDVIEQSLADVDILYASRGSALKRTDNANDATPSWTSCTSPSGSNITALETNETDANIVYATAGSKVYKSTDKGANWTDISGTLPSININTIVYRKNSNEELYIGTKNGVFVRNAGMSDWLAFSTGLPFTDVRELEIYYDTEGTQDRLKAATYGRGLWQSDLVETGVLNPTNLTAVASSSTQIDLSWVLNPSGNNVLLAYSTSSTFGTPVDGTSYTAGNTIAGGGTVIYNGINTTFNHSSLTTGTKYYYKLWSYDGSTNYSGGTTVNETPVASVADFSASPTISCTGSLTVNFTDASAGAYNSWAWDVDNNGTTDYTTPNPVHTYNSPGLYSVKLTISNGDASKTKENLVLVINSAPTVNTGCTITPNNNTSYYIGINHFVLANIDNTTPLGDGYYKDYSCTNWTHLMLNHTYDVTIQTSSSYNEGAKVYIDYDDNGTFDDPGELAVTFPAAKNSRTLSFTSPSSGIVLNKALRMRVLAKYNNVPANACDVGNYAQAEDYTVYFVGDATWTGASSTDWATAGNWNINSIPISEAKIIIPSGVPNYPVLTSAVTCKDLTIMMGTSLTINPGAAMTVTANLVNNAGTNGLQLNADATGTASLLHNTNNIPATVKSYISENKWHMVSAPISNAQSSVFTNLYLMYFNESDYTWHYISALDYDLAEGRGFMAWSASGSTGNATVNYAGTLNNGNLTVNGLSYSPSQPQADRGWNMVGNPYPSSINWNSNWGRTSIDATAYIYNGANYLTWNGATGTHPNGDIAPGQGFFVKASASGASLTIPQGERKNSTQGFYKEGGQLNELFFTVEGNGYSDKMIVQFNDEATAGFDSEFDAWKFRGKEAAPQMYSVYGNNELTVNSLPFESENMIIPVNFKAGAETLYTISVADLENFDEGVEVYLEDLKENSMIDLRQVSSYSFNADPGNAPERFLLHFNNTAFGTEEHANNDFDIYSYDKDVYVNVPASTKGDIKVYNMMGQEIAYASINNTLNKVTLEKSAYYVVVVLSNETVVTEKVFIH